MTYRQTHRRTQPFIVNKILIIIILEIFFDIWERASQIGIGVARDVFDNRVLVTSYKLI